MSSGYHIASENSLLRLSFYQSILPRSPFPLSFVYFIGFRKPDVLTFGLAALGVLVISPLNGELGVRPPELPILLHNLWAAGVNSPETRGLLGNFGTGVRSTFPVSPSFADVLFDCDIRSTMRWCSASFFLCS